MDWEHLKWQDFPAAVEISKGVCVIPMGATEKHGLHLSVGTDNFVVEALARQAAQLEPVVLFPTFRFGQLNNLQHMNGSICLSTRLMLDYLEELCREIARSGFKKILILNGHGGNPPLLNTLTSIIRENKKDYVVAWVNGYLPEFSQLPVAIRENPEAYSYLMEEDLQVLDSYFAQPMESGHADFDETLGHLAACPEAVDLSMMDKEDGRNIHRMDHLTSMNINTSQIWFANQPHHHHASYHPGANPRLGKALMQFRAEHLAKLFRVYKEDTELLTHNEEWNRAW